MYLRSKIFKVGYVRHLHSRIEKIGKILSSSNKPGIDADNYLILQRPKYMHTGIKTWHYRDAHISKQQFYSTIAEEELVDSVTFERVCEETLNSLADYFEDIVASDSKLEKADVVYGAGVLTIDLGNYGIYVINRQSPNKQIWLSSPTSGPKRFDYLVKEDCWIYKHDGQILHSLLKKEFESIVGTELTFSNCSHSNK